MHLPFCMVTVGPYGEMLKVAGGRNHFVEGGFSANLTNARFSVRIKGELEKRGSELCLLVQARHDKVLANWTMSRHPIAVTREWSVQTVTITADERK